MYSIVMLAALTTGADVTPPPMTPPATVGTPVVVSGCTGCTGCTGCYGSCSGSCYGSCTGSCYGCYGSGHGGFFRRTGAFLGHKSSCHGCCGGYSCTGYSCFGSCYGSCNGLSYGSSWGPPVGMLPYTLHGYNSGAYPVYGPGAPVVYGATSPQAFYGNVYYPNLPPEVTVPVAPMTKPTGSDAQPNGANLKFKVPADAKLYVDGKLAPGTGPDRSFYTPALEAGKKFFYDVKAEVVVNGKTVVEEKKVIVEAGASINETFPTLVAAIEKADGVAGK
ncbi:TIGR03000 domain-containing protein [Frigoriglobus tundricola]|uniref:TIGR03000 domain-containing protein n=1 Tax=Frigoriglobus tundricola TaxID=2774151 RepID=A0A6M5YF85_9BACT|nr:TIGR03000 domain-containing protein [Frigoriglobus tundricola]QJW92675.1 hypothetical protein FTUN_0172 [Frigoriglobus tundricola]